MKDVTHEIPVIKTGYQYVLQAAEVHSITVVVSALTQAAGLVSDSHTEPDSQSILREAEKCVQVALTYLQTLIRAKPGSRVRWNVGYTPRYGTVVSIDEENGEYNVIGDGYTSLCIRPDECEIIS